MSEGVTRQPNSVVVEYEQPVGWSPQAVLTTSTLKGGSTVATAYLKPRGRKIPDISGKRFGRLVVVGFNGMRGRFSFWLCRCDCGTEKILRGSDLGHIHSCGCLRYESRNTKHGLWGTYFWSIWRGMISRCYNDTDAGFPNYGGRGIVVCERWRQSMAALAEDMGPRPSSAHSIDRINNNGPYSPDNCRWATVRQQARNRRSNLLIEYHGETKPLSEWAEQIGIHKDTLRDRIVERGWTVERAIETPARAYPKKEHTHGSL